MLLPNCQEKSTSSLWCRLCRHERFVFPRLFNAAEFEKTCRLENTIGGDGDARYQKYHINWRGHILNMGLRRLKSHLVEPTSRHQHHQLQQYPQGIVMDVVIPSYRTNNNDILERIVNLRASVDNVYVKFWIVVDNPLTWHVDDVKDLARRCNEKQLQSSNNYFINVIHYAENRGASYARNTGYNAIQKVRVPLRSIEELMAVFH